MTYLPEKMAEQLQRAYGSTVDEYDPLEYWDTGATLCARAAIDHAIEVVRNMPGTGVSLRCRDEIIAEFERVRSEW